MKALGVEEEGNESSRGWLRMVCPGGGRMVVNGVDILKKGGKKIGALF